ncbi:MAG: hypothetical protein NTY98_00900 [Verrucomicrobia bacterium]|nr:hypothetical protein [Verrucomicrobiota bacterium]
MFRPGIFNETFDTVLFKPELRDSQLYRFACEFIYCVIHEGEIRLSEPQGTDQFYIIRLLEENRIRHLGLERVTNHLHVVQKPRQGRVVPLAQSLAENLLNAKYDFSCLGDALEQNVRRILVAELGARKDLDILDKARQLLRRMSSSASAEDHVAICYWDRLLHKGQNERESLGSIEIWNQSCRNEKLPGLVETNLAAHRVLGGRNLGQCFEDLCSRHRPDLWQKCQTLLQPLLQEALQAGQMSEAEVLNAYQPLVYFNGRSPFYTMRSFWERHLSTMDYLFIKELLDSLYNELVANTSNAGRRVFLPGDIGQADQAEASCAVADHCRSVEKRACYRMAYLSQPVPWEWADFMHTLQGLNEALGDADFIHSRAAYISALEPVEQLRMLKRVALVLNHHCEYAGVSLRINSDRSFTVLTTPRSSPDNMVEMISAADGSIENFTRQGECQHHAI